MADVTGGSRAERRLIRQRGAGFRELASATFGFIFGLGDNASHEGEPDSAVSSDDDALTERPPASDTRPERKGKATAIVSAQEMDCVDEDGIKTKTRKSVNQGNGKTGQRDKQESKGKRRGREKTKPPRKNDRIASEADESTGPTSNVQRKAKGPLQTSKTRTRTAMSIAPAAEDVQPQLEGRQSHAEEAVLTHDSMRSRKRRRSSEASGDAHDEATRQVPARKKKATKVGNKANEARRRTRQSATEKIIEDEDTSANAEPGNSRPAMGRPTRGVRQHESLAGATGDEIQELQPRRRSKAVKSPIPLAHPPEAEAGRGKRISISPQKRVKDHVDATSQPAQGSQAAGNPKKRSRMSKVSTVQVDEATQPNERVSVDGRDKRGRQLHQYEESSEPAARQQAQTQSTIPKADRAQIIAPSVNFKTATRPALGGRSRKFPPKSIGHRDKSDDDDDDDRGLGAILKRYGDPKIPSKLVTAADPRLKFRL